MAPNLTNYRTDAFSGPFSMRYKTIFIIMIFSVLCTSKISLASQTAIKVVNRQLIVDGAPFTGSPDTHDTNGFRPDSGGPFPDHCFTEEWWGIVDIERNPRPTYYAIKKLYNQRSD